MQLGQRVKERRLELGLSLRELAERTDLTASFLSQVERELASPSIESLRRISRALDVPMFRFLVEHDAKSPVVRHNKRMLLSLSGDGVDYQLLTPDLNRNRHMEVFLEEWEPGRERTTMPLRQYTEEFIYVLQGQLEIHLGDEIHQLDAGDSVYFEGPLLHRLAAKGEETLRILSVITPPIF